MRGIVYDRLSGAGAPLYEASTGRTSNASGADPAADPMLALLDVGGHRLIEREEKGRSVVGFLRDLLRDKLQPRLGEAFFQRLVTTGAPLLTKSAKELEEEAKAAKKASAASPSSNSSSSASASASASASPSASTTPADRVVHLETYLQGLLQGAQPKIRMGRDGEGGGDDDVFPSRDADDARLVRITGSSYAMLPAALALESKPASDAEAVQIAAASEVMALTAGVVGDIWLLSHSNYLVGTCLSQVSRMAYELMYATGRARAPPVGMDGRLCRAFPMPAPYTITADWRESFDLWLSDE